MDQAILIFNLVDQCSNNKEILNIYFLEKFDDNHLNLIQEKKVRHNLLKHLLKFQFFWKILVWFSMPKMELFGKFILDLHKPLKTKVSRNVQAEYNFMYQGILVFHIQIKVIL